MRIECQRCVCVLLPPTKCKTKTIENDALSSQSMQKLKTLMMIRIDSFVHHMPLDSLLELEL